MKLNTLLAALITGSATAFLSALGIGAANLVGAHIGKLDWQQLLVVGIAAAIVGAASYLLTGGQPAPARPTPAAVPPPAAPASSVIPKPPLNPPMS